MTWTDLVDTIRKVFYDTPIVRIQDTAITLSHITTAILFIIISVFVSKWIRLLLKRRVLVRMKMEPGLEYALLRFVHYAVLIMGTYIGLATINLPMGALLGVFALLSVGIGFGLQNLAANFISGLIMLLERPIKVGDRITVEEVWGDVTQINLRTTVVTTPDNVAIIIPNSKLLENNVVNWSYGEKSVRIRVPAGVAYGTDPDKVTTLLIEAARNNPQVLDNPAPEVWFEQFGDSSLNFLLLCWIPSAELKEIVNNQLNREINYLFKEHGVEIPFPQRDLHLRSARVPIQVNTVVPG